MTTRHNWIDWMKAIGITLIVYGHFFSIYSNYVYVFSVPLFFLISGFLCRTETDTTTFWGKLWYKLILPMLLINAIDYLLCPLRETLLSGHLTYPDSPLSRCYMVLIGLQEGLGALWFVYTLIILKIIVQYTRNKYIHIFWFTLFSFGAYFIHNFKAEYPFFQAPWAITDVFVSYPFFLVGHIMRKWKPKIDSYQANRYTPCWILLTLLVVIFCGKYHHRNVYLYECGYGDNYFIFLLGGLAGSALVFLISKMLDPIHLRWITDISNGTLLILGFHYNLNVIIRHFFPMISVMDCVFTALIVLLFVPLIRYCAKYTPVIIGKKQISQH